MWTYLFPYLPIFSLEFTLTDATKGSGGRWSGLAEADGALFGEEVNPKKFLHSSGSVG